MIPATVDRVPGHTAEAANEAIRRQARADIAREIDAERDAPEAIRGDFRGVSDGGVQGRAAIDRALEAAWL